jgi:predicted AlkP superfamily phosphohydrolase/phosphomutase
MKKLVVIGFDGATLDILKPMAEKGLLPNLKKIMNTGSYGKLKSTYPPLTGPAWVSFATGKNPGKHGCYNFEYFDGDISKTKTITASDIGERTFYEILDENKKKCIIINLPCSYPPRIKGDLVTSFLTKGKEFIFPNSLKQEVPELNEYRLLPNSALRIQKKTKEYIKDIRDVAKLRFECAKKMFSRSWDFFFVLFGASDFVQHEKYAELVNGKAGNAVEVFKDLDSYLGWFMQNLPKDTNLMIMSDHGFRACYKTFFINKWLLDNGYLKLRDSSKQVEEESADREEVKKSLKQSKKVFEIGSWAAKLSSKYPKLFKIVRKAYSLVEKIAPIKAVPNVSADPQESLAYAIPSTTSVGIYVNDKSRFEVGKVKSSDVKKVRNELIGKINSVKDNGKKVVSRIITKEQAYSGKEISKAPDFLVEADNYCIDASLMAGSVIDKRTTSEHAMNGIFFAYGPDVKKAGLNAEIIDIAPTILHMFNFPVPRDMDGKVLKIFKSKSKMSGKVKKKSKSEKDKLKSVIGKLDLKL